MAVTLSPERPAEWAAQSFEDLMSIPQREREELQLAALRHRFDSLRGKVEALDRLADRQKASRIGDLASALPLFFDHRVYKSYPLSLLENRDFPRLTEWLGRLTTHDLGKVSLDGLKTVDDWLTRLDEAGMIIGHSTGTTGKLSFIPRSQAEWPAWRPAYLEMDRVATGVDSNHVHLPTFFPGYRSGHHMLTRMNSLFGVIAAGGPEHYHTLYDAPVSSDLMSLAGRMQSAEDKGELEKLSLDPALLEAREQMIDAGRRREQDIEAWFTKLIGQYRGQRVRINGSFGDLTRVAQAGLAKGLKCEFAPDSVMMASGGMKGYKGAPEDWQGLVKDFFGIRKISSLYGMAECMGIAPQCEAGHFHIPPYAIPILLDKDTQPLPTTGQQRGRMVLFDLLAETYWGGFISGDEITMYWDEDCACGHGGPRLDNNIRRFAESEGGDDKITCAGSAQAYGEFMDYIMAI